MLAPSGPARRIPGLVRLAALLWLAAALVGCSEPGARVAAGSAEAADEERVMAPDFTLEGLDGQSVRLADLRGKTVIIDFWATWCPPCEFQVPELNAFHAAHAAEGDVAVLGISVDVEGPEVVGRWASEKKVGYPVLLEGEDLARRYGAMGFPTLYIIAPDGTIDSQHVGLIEVGDLEAALSKLRAGGEAGSSEDHAG